MEENIQKKRSLGFLNRSKAPCKYNAARCLGSNTASHFSQVKFISIESCKRPAEWMMPTRSGVKLEINSSVASWELMSERACSTWMPSCAALPWIRFHVGMLSSEMRMDRDKNFIEKPVAPWSSAVFNNHSPITKARAPLPPVMAIVPSLGSKNSWPAFSYSLDDSWRATKRPVWRMRTELCPTEPSRRISEAILGQRESSLG
mmetsp:Transcript_93496/g.194960  ORF Transcript_93496/g.194960 Transcript_93496/m.194960 type:complete len:203 (-) Transcript_93496:942-1550(-)